MNRLLRYGLGILMVTLLVMLSAVFAPPDASAATTSLTIKKLASDKTTVLEQRTVTYQELRDGELSDGTPIDIMGDGITHYYCQGPVFVDDPDKDTQEMLRWNEAEDANWDTKDMGALKGTNVKDLCELVGGMNPGDTIRIKATDGLAKTFAYKNVYEYTGREGPMVVCWYKDGKYPDSGYNDGMRLNWFAGATYKEGPTSIAGLPSGDYHVFGNWDWHEAADPEYWYYFQGEYPTTTGLSVQVVSELTIYSNESPPSVQLSKTEVTTNGDISLTFNKEMADPTGIGAEGQFAVLVDSKAVAVSAVVKTNTAEKIKLELATKVKGGQVVTVAYTKSTDASKQIKTADGGVLESFSAVNATNNLPVAPVAAFTVDKTSGTAPLTVQFTDQSTYTPTSWAWDFDNDGTTDSTEQNPDHQYTQTGTYTVKLTVTNAAGSDDEVKADYITVTTPGPRIWYVDDSGGADFTTIQAAVTAAGAGDTIIVKDGTYTENVVVDKSLVIKSENGADRTAVKAASASADVFKVTAANVTIEGFAVSGATSTGKSGITISGSSSSSCTVINNECSGNSQGISIEAVANNNTVANNTVVSSGRYGIYLINTTGNFIRGNTCSDNTAGSGFALYLADNANNNTVNGNTSDSNTIGIRVKSAHNNTIFDNTSSNNSYGLEIATKSKGNVFYLNNFTGNTSGQLSAGFQAEAGNIWNSQEKQNYEYNGSPYTGYVGNCWSNYTGVDADGNGVVDTPYQTISTDSDNYPLLGQYQNGVITAPAVAPVAAFTADVTSGTAPLTVQFTDQSTNTPTSWAWDFDNDGTTDSTEQNPNHQYTQTGTYTVKLTVTNATGSDDEVKADYVTVSAPPTMDILYDGTVNLAPDETFEVTAYNSKTKYNVNETTPLGALQAAATANGFAYDVSDKNYGASGALLLDNVGDYLYVKGGSSWYAYVNDVFKDGFNNAAGALNLIELVNGDRVEFYYAAGIADKTDLNAVKTAATAAVKTVVSTGSAPGDNWTLQLSGAKNQSVTKAYFENGLTCASSSHKISWTDDDGNVWGGVPLWLLVGMVDDNPDVGPSHFNFNDGLAAKNYKIKVISGDGWSATLDSAAIARNGGYIVANTLNNEPLPEKTVNGKPCWPLHLKGPAVLSGAQVGNIVRIELTDLPQPPAGWTLELIGDVGDVITQAEFEKGLACTGSGHLKEWTDKDGNVWSGVPLWVLLGAVDDIETSSHWTFDDNRAANYTVKVIAGDDFSRTFNGADVAGSNDYIIANECNDDPLTGDSWPLRLVGAGVAKDDGSLGGSAVGNIVKIEIPELQTPEAETGSWNLALNGKISDVISQAEFEAALACPDSGHLVEWTDGEGNFWSGIPLWLLTGWVDDRQPHDYDANQATAGYTILVKAGDGYTKDFASADVTWSNNYIVANKMNGAPLTGSWPLRLVGAGVAKDDGTLGGTSVGNIAEIEITDFGTVQPVPEVRIIKYDEDGVTILDEMTVDYQWMENESGLDVIGDGTTVYRYEGITNNPDDVWDADETYPGGYKIENAVKGTRIKDLCELVGGMGAGTEIVLVAKDDYETRLPYSSIYTDPSVQERQGDAILAWWADGKYVPDYKDGMRLFFTPEDHIYGQWDMHETLPEQYWHYYFSDGVQYPSCAGLSAKYITTIKIYSIPQGDWTLKLDGRDIGGIEYDVSKTYFESALTCQFGANHKASYTDSKERVWEGMPLWFLAGFVDDADQHSDNAFNNQLAEAGYQVIITAGDGHSVTIDSADIIRNNDYIVANTLDGNLIPESDSNWPLRLVGPVVSGATSISNIVGIELVSTAPPLTPPELTGDNTDNTVGQAIDITFADDPAWQAAITDVTVNGTSIAGLYTVVAGNLNIAAGAFTTDGAYTIVVKAAGYSDAVVTQHLGPAAVAAPTADPPPGEVAQGTVVRLTTTTDGAYILYTSDGSEPTHDNKNVERYDPEQGIEIQADTTIKAIAVRADMLDSEIVTFVYTVSGDIDECFIATAAYGSKFTPAVALLRNFRDQCLLTNLPGASFVDFYYRHSPPLAAYIAQHETLKVLVRVCLLPVVAAAYLIMHPLAGLGCVVFLTLALMRWGRRRNLLRV